MNDTFDSKDGEQNIAQGDGAIGKQENVTQTVIGDDNIFSATGDVTVNKYGVPYEAYGQLAGKLTVTEAALASFFTILEEQQVPRNDLDSKLREIAAQYKELLAKRSTDQGAKQAIKAGDYAKAEKLLVDVANQSTIAAAEAYADNARIQRIRLRYAKAAAYWQKAAALLPETEKKKRSLYLHNAAFDLKRIAKYSEALLLWEQSLAITQEIGDRAGEGTTLGNIGALHHARGDYAAALPLYEQSLSISQEIGDRAGEGATLNNISQIYSARGDYDTALTYLEQSLAIMQEIGDRAGAGATLNNLATTAYAKGDYDTALTYLKQSLSIMQEIGDRKVEGTTLNNISQIYHDRGDFTTALTYLEQSLSIRQEIGDRAGEGTTLNNISQIYKARGDSTTALTYLKQSLSIMQEIGAKAEEAVISWNIGLTYKEQGDLKQAEAYISRAVQLAEELGHPKLEELREHLEQVRATLRGK